MKNLSSTYLNHILVECMAGLIVLVLNCSIKCLATMVFMGELMATQCTCSKYVPWKWNMCFKVLCKAGFPACYPVGLWLCWGYQCTYLLLLSLLYTTTHLQVPLILKINWIGNYEKWLLFAMIILYYKTHVHIFHTVIQITIILIIIMLLIWIKDPYVFLPCPFYVSFFYVSIYFLLFWFFYSVYI